MVALFLRVAQPFGKVKYTVSSGDNGAWQPAVRLKAAPGEMEKIVLKPEKLALAGEEITVSLEEVKIRDMTCIIARAGARSS